jgi:hypothetical protein
MERGMKMSQPGGEGSLEPGPARKKPYEKPVLRQVPLRPEEAVLGNCKIAGSIGPAASSCSTYVCSSLGS